MRIDVADRHENCCAIKKRGRGGDAADQGCLKRASDRSRAGEMALDVAEDKAGRHGHADRQEESLSRCSETAMYGASGISPPAM